MKNDITYEYRVFTNRLVDVESMEVGKCTSKVLKDLKSKDKVDGRFFHTSDTDEWFFCWNGKLQKLNLKGNADVNSALDEVNRLIGDANAAVNNAKEIANKAEAAAENASAAATAANKAVETIDNKIAEKANASDVQVLSDKVEAIKDDYALKTDIKEPITYTAGSNIDITDNEISAKGYTYNAETNSIAEGNQTTASGIHSHAEGNQTTASGKYSHAEGNNTTASANQSHAEGYGTKATNNGAHAEGDETTSSGRYSHAEGGYTEAVGNYSHAEGDHTIANNESEHAEGHFNLSNKNLDKYGDSLNTQHSIGVGTDSNNRKNAFEVMQNGDAYLIGVGDYDGTNPSTSMTLQEVINGISGSGSVDTSEFVKESELADKLDEKGYVKSEVLNTELATKADKDELFSGSYNDLTNKPDLFSGSYSDLTDKPTIPSIDGLASKEYADSLVKDSEGKSLFDAAGAAATAKSEAIEDAAGKYQEKGEYLIQESLNNYYTKSEVYTQAEINAKIQAINDLIGSALTLTNTILNA